MWFTIVQITVMLYVSCVITSVGFAYSGHLQPNDVNSYNIIQNKYLNLDMTFKHRLQYVKWYSTDVSEYLVAIPFVFFAFACQPWVMSIYEGLERKNSKKMEKIINRGLNLVLVV
mmetsp:Transcript_52346/g.114498  ORF Transcript_52346/g.114498 Transcript_52346/m.114498 type:complete len:115 (+) Transcript_52346:672-1016(+)